MHYTIRNYLEARNSVHYNYVRLAAVCVTLEAFFQRACLLSDEGWCHHDTVMVVHCCTRLSFDDESDWMFREPTKNIKII